MRLSLFPLLIGLLVWTGTASAYSTTVNSGGGKIHVFIEDDGFELPNERIVAWIQRSADVMTGYFGRFPGEEAHLAISSVPGKGVKNGIALGSGAAIVNVRIGRATDATDLDDDWVLVHELIHLAFPKQRSRHHWAEEGMAVYVESVARTQVGDVGLDTMWRHFMDGMPNGLPEAGDRGLDHTPTWGRIYWGGALFYLLADVEIIRRTSGRKSLKDGLRAIVDMDYSIEDQSELLPLFRIADKAVGIPVLEETYQRMASEPVAPDLDRLWRRLGVERTPDGVNFNDDAEWVEVRKRVTYAE